MPDPWVGHLEVAPLLFLSSNPNLASFRPPKTPNLSRPEPLPELRGESRRAHPSLAKPFESPKWDWSDEEIIDRQESLFDVWMEDGARLVASTDGELGREVPYWAAVRDIARDFLGEGIVPGYDYALAEVVRCKSKKEFGVGAAAQECVPRYLRETIALSRALVIVVLGNRARQEFRKAYAYPEPGTVSSPMPIDGRERVVVFLSHPGAVESDGRALKYPKHLEGDELARVRSVLKAGSRARKFMSEASDVEIVVPPPPTAAED